MNRTSSHAAKFCITRTENYTSRGLDPLVFCGICGVVSAGLGYAMGTQLFKSFWRIMNKEKASMLLEV